MKLFQLDFKMKEYEIYSDLKTPVGSNIIVRLDGRGFHKLAKDLNLEKPYDLNFSKLMADVCEETELKFIQLLLLLVFQVLLFGFQLGAFVSEVQFDGIIGREKCHCYI